MIKTVFLLICVGLYSVIAAATQNQNDFVGASTCQACHQPEYQQWQQSDHHKAMAIASEQSVLGDFSGAELEFHNIKSRFYTKESDTGWQYFVHTLGNSGESREFRIKYTFGHYPLQQYLVELEDGHLQALNTSWDSRIKEEGGQRWFHLRSDEKINKEHPFFWTGHFQNWNSRCADCHSTNLQPNYNAQAHSYSTAFSEVNVACEACHGPGSKHVELAGNKQLAAGNSGFALGSAKKMHWQFKAGKAIAESSGVPDQLETDMCGSCHSLRLPLQENTQGKSFLDVNRLQLIGSPTYFHDGQVREEAFVLGSFLQSKMHAKGVTCGNCHDPHSGKVLAEGNALCSQCHQSTVFDTTKHHQHASGSTGAQCVNCHMPTRNFMQVDDRRDHSFTIPRPQLSMDLGVPNACTQCHAGSSNQWASQQMTKWGITADQDHWAYQHSRAEAGDVLVTRPLAKIITDSRNPEIVRASLLSQFSAMPSRVSVDVAQKGLQSNSPLIRAAAVSSLRALPAESRWQILAPYLADPSRAVRFQLAETLADAYLQYPADEQLRLAKLLEEYRSSLLLAAGSPSSQMAIANLEFNLGNAVKAEKAMLQALRIEPAYVPALLNLADYYRGSGRDKEVEPLLQKALKVAPDSGAAQHSYGLFLVRQQNYSAALPYLKRATEQADAQSRYAFVYAVALDNQGDAEAAVAALVAADDRWPNQYDLLMTLVGYLQKTGNSGAVYPYLSALTAIAPNDPNVKKLLVEFGIK